MNDREITNAVASNRILKTESHNDRHPIKDWKSVKHTEREDIALFVGSTAAFPFRIIERGGGMRGYLFFRFSRSTSSDECSNP